MDIKVPHSWMIVVMSRPYPGPGLFTGWPMRWHPQFQGVFLR